jgi:hypothetical protein
VSRLVSAFLAMSVARGALAQPLDGDQVEERLRFIESRLKSEAVQARTWEAGWSMVFIGGLAYGSYQIAESRTSAELTEGVVGASKSVLGAVGMGLAPLKTSRGTHELDGIADDGSADRRQRLRLAESLLRRNAQESDQRYAWKPHVLALALNLLGGIAICIAKDLPRAAQSTGIAIAVGELQLWTQPWQAKRDLRQYRERFGGMAEASASRPSVRVSASSVQLTF